MGWNFGTPSAARTQTTHTSVDHELASARALPGAGERLGRYALLELLGEGGMGVVYLAYDADLDRRVALKLLREGSADEPDRGRARLLREARALARLADPHVVPVFDVGEADGHAFVTMEYIEGSTLTQWLRIRPRTLAEILAAFAEAGRGLAAAHAIGIVHRDFKPDNVLVGDDGRVRVGDFGLARAAEVASVGSRDPPSPIPLDTGSHDDVQVTRAGLVLGTPAYMAPEQQRGQPITPASDQYAFCVALFEAVYGARPFVADSPRRLLELKLAARFPAAPEHSRVPAWLRAALLRGLSPDPERRWPTLAPLVERLDDRPRRARQRRGWLAVGALTTIAIAMGWPAADRQCDAGERIASGWNEARKLAIAARFDDTGLAYAHDSWSRTHALLDGYAERWTVSHDHACQAARSDGEPEQLDARMHCLDVRLHAFEDLLAVLDDADAETVAHAVTASTALPPLHPCLAPDRQTALPGDPVRRAELVELQRMLGRARVLENTGRFEALRLQAELVQERSAALDFPPLRAEALHVHGSALERLGDYDGARTQLGEALWSAAAAGDDAAVVRVAIDLVWLEGVDAADDVAAQRWQRHAEAAIVRLGGSIDEQAQLANALGAVHAAAGRPTLAREQFAIALAGFEASERELAGYEGVPGPRPDVATALQNIGIALSSEGHHDEARGPLERSLALYEQLEGPEHPDAASTRDALGGVLLRIGELAAARTALERALASRVGALPPFHPDIARSHNNLGSLFEATGELELAEQHYRTAVEIFEHTLGPDHAVVGATLVNLGAVLQRRGSSEQARAVLLRALALVEAALPPEHPFVIWGAIALGRTELARGEAERARVLLERGASACDHAALEPALCGSARLGLALARDRLGEPPARLRASFDAAAEQLTRAGAPGRIELAEARAWLDAHALP